ncbi:MAG: hypothetical protein JSR78_06515 [Proteobacteria bacterium]|nr:hypothetical protein [Pseudomonadota bacterium]
MTRLAESITIRLGGEVYGLRPSLRHALGLERRPGGFPGLLADLQDGSLTAYCDILRPYGGDRKFFTQYVFDALNELQEPLSEYVVACLGIDPDTKPDNASGGDKKVGFKDHLINLYKVGTGWLGWTPDETLDATPTEIRLAYEGRIDLLKAIFGSTDEAENAVPDGAALDDKLKSAFGMFQTIKAKPKHKRKRVAA